uniref:Invertebrate defensins family profile domain-containing protein n=1 Tax=Anopheles albimanus TaxID=7167 RepID=A0A8W7JVV3_ANOAL
MKFLSVFFLVVLALCSLIGGISADVCRNENSRACEMRCEAQGFAGGKCVEQVCQCEE